MARAPNQPGSSPATASTSARSTWTVTRHWRSSRGWTRATWFNGLSRRRTTLIEGDAVAATSSSACDHAFSPGDWVLVVLESDHSRDDVMAELDAYAPLVTPGTYVVVTDGVMQVLDEY